ncbi:MAG: tRNA (adenosine(37)-N6)-threonylcarbamoyltransferase complex dimerization subunit type 1 TsaB [Ahrensia sp.]
MIVLGIDTAANLCAATVYDTASHTARATRSDDIGRGHAEHLPALIADVMDDARLTYGQLHAIAVTIGPGTFTGIRVGVSMARGFALALGLEAKGVTTLQAIAADAIADSAIKGPFTVAIEGGRGQIFAQCFDVRGLAFGDPRQVALDNAADVLTPDTKTIVGNAADAVAQASGRTLLARALPVATGTIETIARLGASATMPASPLYLRGADAKPQTGFALERAP